MRTYICPKCSATQENTRMPPHYLWTTAYTFRCQNCATMLRLDGSRRSLFSFLTLFVLAIAVFTTLDIQDRVTVDVAIMVGLAQALLIMWLIPLKVMVHNDE